MTRTRILIAFCAAIAMLTATATVSSAADKKLFATMTGKQEGQPPGDPDGVGTAVLTFKSNKVCYDIRPKKAGLTFGAGHVHIGKAGVAGDVLIALWTTPKKVTGGKLVGCSATVKAADLAKVKAKPAGFYVNIHSAAFKAGSIRGQLSTTKTA